LLDQGKEGIAAFQAQAETLGIVIGKDGAEAAHQFEQGMGTLKGALMGVSIAVGTALLPYMISFVEYAVGIIVAIKNWAAAHQELIVNIAKVAAIIGGAGGLLLAVAGVLAILPALAAAFAFIISPIGLVVVAIAALVGAFAFFPKVREVVLDVLRAITQEVGAQIAVFGTIAKAIWKLVTGDIKGAWETAKSAPQSAVDGWKSAGQGFDSVTGAIGKGIDGLKFKLPEMGKAVEGIEPPIHKAGGAAEQFQKQVDELIKSVTKENNEARALAAALTFLENHHVSAAIIAEKLGKTLLEVSAYAEKHGIVLEDVVIRNARVAASQKLMDDALEEGKKKIAETTGSFAALELKLALLSGTFTRDQLVEAYADDIVKAGNAAKDMGKKLGDHQQALYDDASAFVKSRDAAKAWREELEKLGKEHLTVPTIEITRGVFSPEFLKQLGEIHHATDEARKALADLQSQAGRGVAVSARAENIVTTSQLHQTEASINLDAVTKAMADFQTKGKSFAETTQLLGDDFLSAAQQAKDLGISVDETLVKQVNAQELWNRKQFGDLVSLGAQYRTTGEFVDDYTKSLIDQARGIVAATQASIEMQDAFGRLADDFSSAIADFLVEGKSLGASIKNMFQDLGRSISRTLFDEMLAPLKNQLKDLGAIISEKLTSVSSKISSSVGGAVSGLFAEGSKIGKKLGDTIGSVAGPLAAAGIGMAISAIANAIGKGRRTANEFVQQTQNQFGTDLGKDVEAFNALASSGHASASQLLDAYKNITGLIDQFKTDAAAFASKGSTEAKVVKQAWDTMTQNFGPDFVKVLGPMGDKLKELGVDVTQATGDVAAAAKALDDFENSVESIVKRTTADADDADALAEAMKRLQAAGVPLRTILAANGDAIKKAVAQLQDLGRDVPQVLLDLNAAMSDLGAAAQQTASQFEDAVDSMLKSITSYADNANVLVEALTRAQQQGKPDSLILEALGDQIKKTVEQMQALGLSIPPILQQYADKVAQTGDAAKAATKSFTQTGPSLQEMLHQYQEAYANGFRTSQALGSPNASTYYRSPAGIAAIQPAGATASQTQSISIQQDGGVTVHITGTVTNETVTQLIESLERNQSNSAAKLIKLLKKDWNGVGQTLPA
jgi:hypothetical protein